MSKSRTAERKRLARIGRSRMVGAGFSVLSGAQSVSAPRVQALCREVRYAIPGLFPTTRHPDPKTAWAAQVAALATWRDDTPYTVEQALAKIGEPWVEAYRAGKQLTADDTARLIATAGLCAPPPQSLSAEGWEAMLRTYGPLVVIPSADDVVFPARGRIVVSITGDGTPAGTSLGLVDLESGTNVTERLSALPGPLRLVHWHADAGLARGARPTAPVETAANGASPAPSDAAPMAASLSRRRISRAAEVPDWDQPANFPDGIRRFWADIGSRMHHYIWHAVRLQYPHPDPGVMAAFTRMGFTPPPRLARFRDRRAAAGAGVDFLNMHRQMMQATRTLAARLGISYRPTGWNPIPWNHRDAVWPMPVWPSGSEGPPEFKTSDVTVFWRGQVRDNLENATWLARLSLDDLGITLEEGIHNWMHMHWAAPQPSAASRASEDPSNDWLGSTFSSQVNPVFWKLHGFIDDCITRWEKAPAQAGIGAERSAAGEFSKYNWLGPVPNPSAGAKSLSGHNHGNGDISNAELNALASQIDFAAVDEFPFADLSRSELVAQFGPVGELPEVWLAEAEGGGDADVRTASLSTGRRIVSGWERHGVRQMSGQPVSSAQGGPLAAAELGVAVFSALQPLVSGGDVSYEAQISEFIHPLTPPETPATRLTYDLKVTAHHPRYVNAEYQYIYFQVQCDYNGYDLKNCRIDILRDKSASLTASTFNMKFAPVAASRPGDTEARISYMISGRWDPWGLGDFSFEGELQLTAGGSSSAKITRADENRVWISDKDGIQNVRRVPLPGPMVVTQFWDTLFSPPGSDKVTQDGERALLAWVDRMLTDDRRNVGNGTYPLEIHGYASTTGPLDKNRDLSRRRAEKVQQILRDALGPNAKMEVVAHGEWAAGTPDETEVADKRRVRVQFKKYIWP